MQGVCDGLALGTGLPASYRQAANWLGSPGPDCTTRVTCGSPKLWPTLKSMTWPPCRPCSVITPSHVSIHRPGLRNAGSPLARPSEPPTRESGATSTTRRTEASASTAKIIDLLDKLFGVPARLCRLPTGLLTLEISFQYKRNPALCQRNTVSGVTTLRDCCHPDQNRVG